MVIINKRINLKRILADLANIIKSRFYCMFSVFSFIRKLWLHMWMCKLLFLVPHLKLSDFLFFVDEQLMDLGFDWSQVLPSNVSPLPFCR